MTSALLVPTLADLTTMRVGGPADRYVEVASEAELIDTVHSADVAGEPVLVVGGGSNLVVADEGFPGVVIRDVRTGVTVESQDVCGGAAFTVPSGQDWDQLVERAIAEEWSGLEALSGIPGTVGAAPVQNIGAYGQEVADSVASVRVWDRYTASRRTLPLADLGFGYRTSVLKRSMQGVGIDEDGPWYPTPRYVVLEVAFQTRLASLSAPIAYGELARRLGVEVGERAPVADVRRAVLELRAGKGMLVDDPGARDHDRWSAGSFFTNPILTAEQAAALPEDAPRYPMRPQPELGAIGAASLVKTSAAWLIEHAGFTKGFGVHGSRSFATLSTRHTLALTNRGGASTADILELARAIRDGVLSAFSVELVPEPVLVGVSL